RIVGPAVIGDGCVIGASCLITAACLETNVSVGAETRLCDSVLGAGTRVGAGCMIESSWLDDQVTLGDGAILRAQRFSDLQPTADTSGLLSRDTLCTRGAVIGPHITVSANEIVAPGTIFMHS
ncbi:MAG: nucleotidyl transferase, partial [Oscillochloris sp.]|nr:nucleotidyl transferase [Oscillochloris sp.]